MDLKLNSPAGADPIFYSWPFLESRETDIIETMKWVCEDLPELRIPLERNILNDYNLHDYKSMKELCKRFNRTVCGVVSLAKGTSLPAQRFKKSPSRGLLKHIMQQVYNEAIIAPEKLNQYKPFSPEVYGETSYDLVNQMIDSLDITSDDVFIDLGSGVGQVVLQMAAATPCKLCLGIERAEVPNAYALVMERQFRKWMLWYGKKFGNYQLINDDFFAQQHTDKLNAATIVFVNNLAFGPEVDHQLKLIFANFKDGVYIVSSKSFCPLNFRITDRNLSDLATICNVTEMAPVPGSVSWTGSAVSYYIHIIDRTKLEKYFERLKNTTESPVISSKQESSNDSGWSDACSHNSDEASKKIQKAKLKKRPNQALKALMRGFKSQYIAMLKLMKQKAYREKIEAQIEAERERKRALLFRVAQIDKQIVLMKQEGVDLMKARMRELGIEETADDLLAKSKAIVNHNRMLQEQCKMLENEVKRLERIAT